MQGSGCCEYRNGIDNFQRTHSSCWNKGGNCLCRSIESFARRSSKFLILFEVKFILKNLILDYGSQRGDERMAKTTSNSGITPYKKKISAARSFGQTSWRKHKITPKI